MIANILLVSAALAAAAETGGSPSELAKAAFDFKYDPAKIIWISEVTPPFPVAWPPDGSGAVVYYAYARGHGMGLTDAEYVGSIWAKITETPGKKPVLERIGGPLREIGTRGVWPITKEEIAALPKPGVAEAIVEKLVRGKTVPKKPVRDLKTGYCRWYVKSTIGKALAEHQKPFQDWLSCGKSR